VATIQLSTAQSAGFIPQFWANRALDVLRTKTPLARLVQSDKAFGPGDFATQGSTLTIPYPGTFVAVDKAQGTPVTPQVPVGGSSVALTLSKHKVVPFSVEDFANAQANMDLMDRYMTPAVIAIATQFEQDLFALYAGLTTAISSAGTAITAAVLRTVRNTFLQQRAAEEDRSVVLTGADEIAILGDSNLATYFAFSQTQALKEGSIGRLYGLDIYSSQNVPVTGDIYTLTIGGSTGGTWAFDWNGNTVTVPWNATGAALQTLLQAMPFYGPNFTVGTVAAGGPWVVTLTAPAADVGVAPTIDTTNLTTGTSITESVVKTDGAANQNIAIQKDSFMFATRPFRDPGADTGVKIATAVDPQTGLSLRVAGQYDINAMAMRINVDMLYGMVNLRPNVGMVVLS
jgi:hypothetical protein